MRRARPGCYRFAVTSLPVLRLSGFGVAYGSSVVLAEVDLEVPARGVTVLFGPAGTGKSTLLRTIAGLLNHQPDVRTWGAATYLGQPLGAGPRPHLVVQDVRHFVSTVFRNLADMLPARASLTLEQKRTRVVEFLHEVGVPELVGWLEREAVQVPSPLLRLLPVLRALASEAPLICLDESTARLDAASVDRTLGLLRHYATTRAVLFVTHHQGHARAVADHCALMAGGRVLEAAPAAEFFARPRSDLTRHFLETGGVPVASPMAAPEVLAEGVAPPPPLPPAAVDVLEARGWEGPRQFRWLLPGRLGGCPRPGIVDAVEDDLAALRRVGVDLLVSLEETVTVSPSLCAQVGIESIHFPIIDMKAPPCASAAAFCAMLADRLARGARIAIHCRAGHGRTGTMLAALRIFHGLTAVEALDEVRGVNPKWVTSDEQVRFLDVFAAHLRSTRSPASTPEGTN